MNQGAVIFEACSIALLLFIGFALSSVNIQSTGILTTAGLLCLFFATSRYKTVLGLATHFAPKQSWSASSTNNTSGS